MLVALLALSACGGPQRQDALRGQPAPTFSRDIAAILFDHCASCHRPGQVAPFSLLQYADARPRAKAIARATLIRQMPPWLPDASESSFMGERVLRDDQIQTVQRWVEAGALEGNPADLPKMPAWTEGWQLGKPDLVVTMPRPYVLQPGDRDVYRNVVMPLSLPSGRFVRAVEFQTAGAPVHHAVIRVDRAHASRWRDGEDGQPGFDGMVAEDVQDPGGQFLGWAPGRGPIVSPEDMAWRLEAGSDLIVELHLLPGKSPIAVQPSVGLFFTDRPPAHEPVMGIISAKTIDIPAGERDYVIEETYQLPVDVDVLSVYPHAHYLGKEMQVRAVLPDGKTKSLIHIRQWSFHWQQDYRYVTPIALPRGTKIVMRYTYDNSDANKDNPHRPPEHVIWGPRSSDEMGTLGLQLLPHSSGDRSALVKSFAERQALEDVAGAELAVRYAPDDEVNQTNLGSSYVRAGRFAEAIPHLERALRLDPRSANAHNYLGGALLAEHRVQEALVQFRQASELAPRDEHLHFNLGKVLDEAGQPAEAAQEFERAIAINPDLWEAHQQLGVVLFSHNQLTGAILHLTRAAELAPDSAAVHSDLGGALAAAGRSGEALIQIRRALELDPGYPPARENLARLQTPGRPQQPPPR
ncbi:MAG TPA: tetratricopeptide repeat protein [Vicinamibacterales bacterium]|jgi:Flp pilus assembly protein TadD|nr:tetratricopeptide repeat protein [Vicinamibacterales bacterium]